MSTGECEECGDTGLMQHEPVNVGAAGAFGPCRCPMGRDYSLRPVRLPILDSAELAVIANRDLAYCPYCKGRGRALETDECAKCGGTGTRYKDQAAVARNQSPAKRLASARMRA
jgi:RecJ-like exonuclease